MLFQNFLFSWFKFQNKQNWKKFKILRILLRISPRKVAWKRVKRFLSRKRIKTNKNRRRNWLFASFAKNSDIDSLWLIFLWKATKDVKRWRQFAISKSSNNYEKFSRSRKCQPRIFVSSHSSNCEFLKNFDVFGEQCDKSIWNYFSGVFHHVFEQIRTT